VGEAQRLIPGGLAAGQTTAPWFAGYAFGGETVVMVDGDSRVEESDEDNNTFSQWVPIPTLPPTCAPASVAMALTRTPGPPVLPTATPALAPLAARSTPRPRQSVSVREGQITIPTYPYSQFTSEAWNEAFRTSVAVLDREAYAASGPMPAGVSYRLLVVENEYLKLTFLPDLGGRLYEVFFKPTGHRESYRNPVLKPSPWGPPEQGWWLAAGGLEWCLPVAEHGYEWGIPWQVEVRRDDKGVTVLLRDSLATDRIRAEVAVRLEANAGSFSLRPRLENPTGAPLAVKFWTNAMLAPGGRNTPTADLTFVLPDAVTEVTVHSRGDDALPGYGQRMSWPIFDGRDLSRLGNWGSWLGFFEDPAAGDFLAVYDEGYDEGMVRVFPAGAARGAKVFGMGWAEPIEPQTWTDDGSSYVEVHGGPAPTFDENVTVPAGGHLEWTETWYPVGGLGGLRYANEVAALNLEAGQSQAHLAVTVTRPWSGDVALLVEGQELWRTEASLVPGRPMLSSVPLGTDVPPTGSLTLRLTSRAGVVDAEYSAAFRLR
jgi:hypothetical protein